MTGLLWNILLSLTWAALTADFSPKNLLIGFALGFLILFFARPIAGSPNYFKARQLFALALFFVWELVLANLRVAHDVMTPTHHMRPGVIAVPLDAASDIGITTLANMISLTPGTLSLDVSTDRRVLYVHFMYIDRDDFDAAREKIKRGFERRVLEVLR